MGTKFAKSQKCTRQINRNNTSKIIEMKLILQKSNAIRQKAYKVGK